ncbi:MAG: T9SS type A sorting domain-containing protein [Candidatus Delongbacteria bacterium]|nr:T9SS type A sorting domain-containing protein [Candidatus Delongbacteria bacterium]
MKSLRILIVFLLVCVSINLYGIYHKVGEYYDGTKRRVSIEKSDSLLFSLTYAGLLEIIDVSNPLNPELISELQMDDFFGGRIGGVFNQKIYLCGEDSISVVDISDIPNPEIDRTYGFGNVRQIIESGNILYIADDQAFYVYDTTPRYEGIVWSCGDNFTSIILSSDSLIYGVSDKFKIMDVKDPENPEFISELSISNNDYGGLAIQDSIAYVSSVYFTSIDIRNIQNPVVMDSLADNPSSTVSISGNKACTNAKGLSVIDITDPYNLSYSGTYDSLGEDFRVIADGDLVYDCDGFYGIHVIDISDPTNDYLLGSTKTVRRARDIEFKDGYLLTADGYSLNIIDVRDSYNPTSIGYFFNALGETFTLSLYDNILCLGYSYQKPDMLMIDITDPTNPVELYDFDYVGTDLTTMNSDQDQDYIYLNTLEEFKIYEKSDAGDPVLKGSYFAEDWITDIVVSNRIAYVTLESKCIDLIDVSSPDTPSLKSTIDLGIYGATLAIRNNILFVSHYKNGLKIYDVSDPTSPILLDSLSAHQNSITSFSRPYIYDGQLFLFDTNWNELFIYDIMDIDNITLLQSIKYDRYIGKMIYVNDLLYSTNLDYGVSIMDISQFVSIDDTDNNIIQNYELEQNYPNPFNPSTSINFSVPHNNSKIKLVVYNVNGQLVSTLFDGLKNKGRYSINFDASALNSGVYYYSFEVNGVKEATKKMVMIK